MSVRIGSAYMRYGKYIVHGPYRFKSIADHKKFFPDNALITYNNKVIMEYKDVDDIKDIMELVGTLIEDNMKIEVSSCVKMRVKREKYNMLAL